MTTNERGAADPARAGIEHLQAAAHEMLAAARSMLDAVEELVDDPNMATSLVSAFATVGRVVEGAVSSVADAMAGRGERSDHDDEPHVQRIKVS